MGISIGSECYISPSSVFSGDVAVGNRVAVMHNAVLRGDFNLIEIGDDSNVQDNVSIHVEASNPCIVGRGVSIGHNAIVHGCVIGHDVLVGMGAIIMNGSNIGSGSVIGAGTLLTAGFTCPENSLVIGSPGKVIRSGQEVAEMAKKNAASYSALRERYISGEFDVLTGHR
ncbi:MAG: gamma carbonic anhydrase family protein [Candidatus Thermoplasmatota archaeon]|jgi:carbonic anhydrase/acetyltransferase-like protein (isoleucine patch superfamily)|nr:gamma carbonic anhydrase family protein [Candidatus Thermoplasmatota archaeon]MCL5793717.1 gamma carbonic anhydrase family protein [Candidatus Thermoplasmatota archaeon]